MVEHPALATRPVRTLLGAARRGALPQGLLLHGRDAEGLEAAALALAGTLLDTPGYAPKSGQHADLFWLRPSGKMRQIRIGDSSAEPNSLRNLLHNVSLAPSVARRKVAVVVDADCFNASAANAFLKTLEEPPADTTLLLLSTRPHAILPTIRSRCLHFFIGTPPPPAAEPLRDWCDRYKRWLGVLDAGLRGKEAAADPILNAYGLVARATACIEQLAQAQLEANPLPENLAEDERAAAERGMELAHRRRFIEEIAVASRDFAAERLIAGNRDDARLKLTQTLDVLEKVSRLMRYNLSDGAALEHFLLSLLRIWVRTS